jgi:hypothetical protein
MATFSSPLSSELFLAPLRAGQFFVCLSSGSRKKAVVVLEAVELVGNPQGCPSGGGLRSAESTGAANPQQAYFFRYFLSGNRRVAIRGQAKREG